MSSVCSTCLQSFSSKNDISNCCGHVFHNVCVTKWIETGEYDCSKQRKKCTTSQIIKFYFESVTNFINELQDNNLKLRDEIKVMKNNINEAKAKLQTASTKLSKNLYDLRMYKSTNLEAIKSIHLLQQENLRLKDEVKVLRFEILEANKKNTKLLETNSNLSKRILNKTCSDLEKQNKKLAKKLEDNTLQRFTSPVHLYYNSRDVLYIC